MSPVRVTKMSTGVTGEFLCSKAQAHFDKNFATFAGLLRSRSMETLGGNKGLQQRGPLSTTRYDSTAFRRRKVWRRVVVACVLAGSGLPGYSVAKAKAISVVAGVCEFEALTATFVPALPAGLPAPVRVDLDGDGTCLLSDTTEYIATIGGTLDPIEGTVPNYSCAGGMAVGNVTLAIPGYTHMQQFSGDAVWVATATTATLEVVGDTVPPQFAGSGAFVSTDGVSCVMNGLGLSTWSGAFAFEDPVV